MYGLLWPLWWYVCGICTHVWFIHDVYLLCDIPIQGIRVVCAIHVFSMMRGCRMCTHNVHVCGIWSHCVWCMLYVFKWNCVMCTHGMCGVWHTCTYVVYMCVVSASFVHCGTLWHVMCYVYVVLVYVKCGTYRYMICVVFGVGYTCIWCASMCFMVWCVLMVYVHVCTHTFEDMTVIRRVFPFSMPFVMSLKQNVKAYTRNKGRAPVPGTQAELAKAPCWRSSDNESRPHAFCE